MTASETTAAELEIAVRLAEMAQTSEVLFQASDLAGILQGLAARAQTVTGADYAAISTFDEEGKLTRFIYTGMGEEQARRLGSPPAGNGLLGELARHSRPMRLERLREHTASSGWPPAHPDMDAFLGVPIRAGGRTIGSLYMTRSPGRPPFDQTDEAAASVLSLQAAVSVASAMHRERSGRVSLLEERVRIAHDLHDGTIQTLYALGLELDSASDSTSVAELSGAVRTSVGRINDLISDIRGYITMLEAETPLAQPELTRDIAFIIRQLVPPGTDTVVNITAAALQELTSRDSEDLLYIAREALSNAVRHGLPTKVAVDLRQTADSTSLTVQDNGVGFDQATARTGLGTVTMRTRAERLSAELSILGIPGMGTTVRVSLPRRSEEGGE
ncbi:MAG: GAF domain-containing protein [Tepidiformaceae bacterium]